MSYPARPPHTRFWPKVAVASPDDCWLWLGAVSGDYGYFWDGKRQVGAHQFALTEHYRINLLPGECALHTCDNTLCVNPTHLFAGTNDDNSKDMVAKGRKERGEKVNCAKLTEIAVVQIRNRYAAGETAKEIADGFDITSDNILVIVKGLSWRHAGGPIGIRQRGPRIGKPQPWVHKGGGGIRKGK